MVATKITYLEDVSMRTITYPALAVAQPPTVQEKKEVVLMRHENGTPTKRLRRLSALSTMAVVVLVAVVAAIAIGPGRVIDWLGAYLIPVLVVLGVIVGVFGLAAWEIAKLHDKHKQPW
jgi:hypothetical protein